ncbi:hypothetical protein MKX01_011703 [Papaver californicum]|nr:hypothetical protein MKX01_011703 [Papaver californicum]
MVHHLIHYSSSSFLCAHRRPISYNFRYYHLKLPTEKHQGMGVQQRRGWVHYVIDHLEPHIMLFRRPLNFHLEQQQQQ